MGHIGHGQHGPEKEKKQIIDGAIWLMVDIALEKEDAGLKVETITTTTTDRS